MSVKEGTPSNARYMPKQKSQQSFEETKVISDEDMAKKIMGNFHQYVSKEAIPEEEEETKSSNTNKQKSVRQDFYIY